MIEIQSGTNSTNGAAERIVERISETKERWSEPSMHGMVYGCRTRQSSGLWSEEVYLPVPQDPQFVTSNTNLSLEFPHLSNAISNANFLDSKDPLYKFEGQKFARKYGDQGEPQIMFTHHVVRPSMVVLVSEAISLNGHAVEVPVEFPVERLNGHSVATNGVYKEVA